MHDSAELSVVPTAEVLGVTILPMLLNLVLRQADFDGCIIAQTFARIRKIYRLLHPSCSP
jgi:hypothetical protein